MKAIINQVYGSPDILELKEVPKPVPTKDEVLVKVHAASANPLDWHALRGKPFFYRLSGAGFLKPKFNILGADVAGEVEAVGSDVISFRTGDEVIGDLFWHNLGAFAEYVCIPQNSVSLKPPGVSYEEAASVIQGSITALHCFEQAKIQPGQKVLVNGASGGVGVFAVQLGKKFGAEVSGVCSTGNVEMVRSIGADHVIDYKKENFIQSGGPYDLIIDNVGNRSIPEYKSLLAPGGNFILVGFSFSLMIKIMLKGKKASQSVGQAFSVLMPKKNDKDMDCLKELLETGKIKAPLANVVWLMKSLLFIVNDFVMMNSY